MFYSSSTNNKDSWYIFNYNLMENLILLFKRCFFMVQDWDFIGFFLKFMAKNKTNETYFWRAFEEVKDKEIKNYCG